VNSLKVSLPVTGNGARSETFFSYHLTLNSQFVFLFRICGFAPHPQKSLNAGLYIELSI